MFQGIFKSAINDANKNYIFGTGSIPINIKVANLETFANSSNKQQGYQVAEVNKLISTMLTGWDANGSKPKSMSNNYLELILSCDNGFVVKKRLQFPHIIAWKDDSTPYNIADVYKEFSIDNWLKADDFENPDITLVVEPTDEILTTSTATPPEATTEQSGIFYLYYRNLPVGVNRVHIDFNIKTKTEPIDFDLEVIDGLSWEDAQVILASNDQAKINVLLSTAKDVYKYTGAEGNFEEITMHKWSALYQQIISLAPSNKFTHDLYFVLYKEYIEESKNAIEEAKAATTEAIKQATYAKTQGDYAKSQGDFVKQFISNPDDLLTYGVEIDTTSSSPTLKRIGNPQLHKSLPIQSKMKGCLLDDNGNVTKYLSDTDWTDNQCIDGTQGQVMVEIPKFYYKFETDGDIQRVRISEYPLSGYKLSNTMYVGAYEASLQRSTLKLCSVCNYDADYRGGGNQSDWDGTYRSVLGRPATEISRTNFRKYARNRNTDMTNWNIQTYQMYKMIYWLYTIEYASLNCQLDYNAELTSEGYHQGGLGNGVTNWSIASWDNYNGFYPFVPCGYTNSLGNGTGIVPYEVKDADGNVLHTTNVPRYRGIENPFGHIWKYIDGINIRISPTEENGGDGLSKVYVCKNTSLFSDTNYDGYDYVGDEAREGGFVKKIIFGDDGEIIPLEVGGGSTSYFCDHHQTNIPTSAEIIRAMLFGGLVVHESGAGLSFASSYYVPSRTIEDIGSRLCFVK